NTSLRCDSNTYWAKNGEPAWQLAKDKYYSLEDWQKTTGQDLHSNYAQFTGVIPSWHKYLLPANPFKKIQKSNVIQVGKKAPAFSANTFSREQVNLSDYKKNLILLTF